LAKKKSEKEPSDGIKTVAVNRKAGYDYELLERMEAGLVLLGTEVKSARQGKVNLKDSYAAPDNGELFLVQCHISSWTHAHYDNHDPLRRRKLLMRRREIRRLIGKITERGLTVIPTRAYFRNGRLKVELALAKGKRHHDRRAALRERDIERETQAALKERNR
jgi:SsrA-binding protein